MICQIKKITVYANFSREYMYDKGIKAGLSEKAAGFFSYYSEKKLVLTVDTDSGEVKKAQVAN